MLIALDFDGTYTRDMALWNSFIIAAKQKGHEIVCITMRSGNPDDKEDAFVKETIGALVDQIIFTDRKAKFMEAIAEMGKVPDVWIDDNPMWIYKDSR